MGEKTLQVRLIFTRILLILVKIAFICLTLYPENIVNFLYHLILFLSIFVLYPFFYQLSSPPNPATSPRKNIPQHPLASAPVSPSDTSRGRAAISVPAARVNCSPISRVTRGGTMARPRRATPTSPIRKQSGRRARGARKPAPHANPPAAPEKEDLTSPRHRPGTDVRRAPSPRGLSLRV